MNGYTIGDLVHCRARFTDPVTHQLLQPGDVAAEVKDSSGVVTTPEPYADGEWFAVDVDTTAMVAGTCYYRFSSPSAKQGAAEGSFVINPSAFA